MGRPVLPEATEVLRRIIRGNLGRVFDVLDPEPFRSGNGLRGKNFVPLPKPHLQPATSIYLSRGRPKAEIRCGNILTVLCSSVF